MSLEPSDEFGIGLHSLRLPLRHVLSRARVLDLERLNPAGRYRVRSLTWDLGLSAIIIIAILAVCVLRIERGDFDQRPGTAPEDGSSLSARSRVIGQKFKASPS
jgi:hypothetical protein